MPDTRQGMCSTERVMVLNDQGGAVMDVSYEVTATLRAQDHGHPPLVYDARGNGEGSICPTITGDHQNRITDYTAVVLQRSEKDDKQMIVAQRRFSNVIVNDTDVSPTLEAGAGEGGNNLPMLVDTLVFDESQITSPVNGNKPGWNDPCHTLSIEAGRADVIIRNNKEMDETVQDKTGPLLASGYSKLGTQEAMSGMYVTEEDPVYSSTTGSYMSTGVEQTSTLMARDYKDPTIVGKSNSVVRRLTPDECASLQGFPRDWCNIGDWVDSKGKLHKDSDSPKYKAYGNSIAVGYDNNASGFWCWLARRICAQYEHRVTMGSLFDGIGGFPLAFSACGAIPVWASEIEEFPIAVTKKHFPE